MKIRGVLFIATFALLAVLRAAEPVIEFSGVLTADGHTKLALTNKATGATTWVEPGESFMGYTVARYDAKEDAVFLKKGVNETRLSLNTAKSPATIAVSAAPAPSPTPVAATQPATPVTAPASPPAPPAPAAPPPTTVATVPPPPAATPPDPSAAPKPDAEPLEATGRPTTPVTYTTGFDDTWESIAQKTGVPVTKLKELNSPLQTGSSLPQAQVIRLR